MKRVIIESPFASTTLSQSMVSIRYLRACMADSLARGEAPFASHGLYTQDGVLDDTDPDQRRRGIYAGFAWREVSDLTVVYTDLGISRGMQEGIEHARDQGHPIEYRRLEVW